MKKIIKKILWGITGGYKPKEFWEKWAETFMDDPWQVATHSQHTWMLAKIKKEKSKTILEIGCGFGRNIKFLQEKKTNAKIEGIDISETMIKKATTFIRNKNVKLRVGDVLNLPYKDKEFDTVLVHGVFMHVKPKDISRAISETVRVSKKSIINIEQNYGGNEYTFIHDYKSFYKSMKGIIAEHKSNKKIGLDYFYVKVR